MSDHYLQNLEDQTAQEESVFQIFQERHSITNPPPEKPSETLRKNLDWQFWATIITSLFNVVLASTRTAQAFFEISYKQFANLTSQFPGMARWENPFSIFEAFVAIAAVELTLLVFATRISVQRRRRDPDTEVNEGRLWAGIALTAFISIVAGTSQSLFALETPIPWLSSTVSILLMLATGPAISIAVIISGEILGHVIADATLKLLVLESVYIADIEEWQEKMVRSWKRSRKQLLGITNQPPPKPMAEPEKDPTPSFKERPEYYNEYMKRFGRELTIAEIIVAHCTSHNISPMDLEPSVIYNLYPDKNRSSVRAKLNLVRKQKV